MDTITILLSGGYRNRNPLAYHAIRHELGARVALVDDPADAQILLISHFKDLELFGAEIAGALRRWPGLRLVMLSEEPFWDSCWMPDPFGRRQHIVLGSRSFDCTVLNHTTTRIFEAARIPYFLLTDPRYMHHYRPLLARNAGWGAQEWVRQFRDAPNDAVFVMARRLSPALARAHRGDALRGLSVWRTRFARSCTGPRVARIGAGWDAGPPRQDLPDWHADKLARFDLATRYMGAFENTHHAEYVTEKIWDAFAVGAIPLYVAGAGHAVFRLIGADGWLNFHAQLREAPSFDARRAVDPDFAAAYARLQERLALLFGDHAAIAAEYDRLCSALLAELAAVVQP